MLKGFSGRVCAAAMVLAISCGAHAASDLRFDFDGDGKDSVSRPHALRAVSAVYVSPSLGMLFRAAPHL